jgi:hypothetical protein
LIIVCVGDVSKLQLYIWSSYGLLAEIKKSSYCPVLSFSKFMDRAIQPEKNLQNKLRIEDLKI